MGQGAWDGRATTRIVVVVVVVVIRRHSSSFVVIHPFVIATDVFEMRAERTTD